MDEVRPILEGTGMRVTFQKKGKKRTKKMLKKYLKI